MKNQDQMKRLEELLANNPEFADILKDIRDVKNRDVGRKSQDRKYRLPFSSEPTIMDGTWS
jgi:hypothetical protein